MYIKRRQTRKKQYVPPVWLECYNRPKPLFLRRDSFPEVDCQDTADDVVSRLKRLIGNRAILQIKLLKENQKQYVTNLLCRCVLRYYNSIESRLRTVFVNNALCVLLGVSITTDPDAKRNFTSLKFIHQQKKNK